MADEIYGLGEGAARDFQKMRALMNIRDVKKSPAQLGARTVLVECISDTSAVGNSVIAPECFSGLLLEALSTANGSLGTLGTVWLTVYDGDSPGTPAVNTTYLGIMVGDVTLDVDANSTNVTRPRVFGVPVTEARAVLQVTGAIGNGTYPANRTAELAAGNLTWSLGTSQVRAVGLNGETLTNGTRYAEAHLASGLGNGNVGAAANLPVYAVVVPGNGTSSNATFLGNVINNGNATAPGNVGCLTLASNGVVQVGSGNLNYSFAVASANFPTTQRLALLTVGSSNVPIPATPADGTGNHGWVTNTTQTLVGDKTGQGNWRITGTLIVDGTLTGNTSVRFNDIGNGFFTALSTTSVPGWHFGDAVAVVNNTDGQPYTEYSNATAGDFIGIATSGPIVASRYLSFVAPASAGNIAYHTLQISNATTGNVLFAGNVVATGTAMVPPPAARVGLEILYGNFSGSPVVITPGAGRFAVYNNGNSALELGAGSNSTIGANARFDKGLCVDLGSGSIANQTQITDLQNQINQLANDIANITSNPVNVVESVDFGLETVETVSVYGVP